MNDSTPALLTVAGILACVVLFFGVRACGVFDTKTFGVAQQNADTDVYRHSEAYREGLTRDFDELLISYNAAKTPEEKAVVLSTLRHRAEEAPPEYVPTNVRNLLVIP